MNNKTTKTANRAQRRKSKSQDGVKALVFKRQQPGLTYLSRTNEEHQPGLSSPTSIDCARAEFGTYTGQVHAVTPGGKLVGIDSCIFSEVRGLWEDGITTIESCCGHNKAKSYIAVAENDVAHMLELGYQPDKGHETGCVFYSKTSRHSK
ncbi:hypothetical protein [Klebsiella michiganensis]|uniref:hypothetical protein n=1 Tax=Klebsiella michiganensis TaxID=1134687 RepID=UPI000C79E9A3|nr:hypothetical protein [Klebsiella michiganensis]PLN98736.1 hypothetical protein CWN52_20315 [Klebsiella michiganensis]PLP25379.1 hypothetical protein CWM92_20490 [Klebsiella michiganensis]